MYDYLLDDKGEKRLTPENLPSLASADLDGDGAEDIILSVKSCDREDNDDNGNYENSFETAVAAAAKAKSDGGSRSDVVKAAVCSFAEQITAKDRDSYRNVRTAAAAVKAAYGPQECVRCQPGKVRNIVAWLRNVGTRETGPDGKTFFRPVFC